MGTCAMKPREEGGVVDANLNVYGVEGLKVLGTHDFISPVRTVILQHLEDLSIPPSNVCAVSRLHRRVP